MATQNGISVTSSGTTGTKTLSVSAEAVTGRLENSSGVMVGRTASFVADGTGVYSDISSSNIISITQNGKSAFLDVSTSSSTSSFPAAGGSITYSGKSNLKKITLGSLSGGISFTTSSINGATVSNISSFSGAGYAPTNDPGNTQQYDVYFTFSIPANSTSGQKTHSFVINGVTKTITQSAEDVAVSSVVVSPSSLVLSTNPSSSHHTGVILATVNPQEAPQEVGASSESPSVASVDSGTSLSRTVTGVSEGVCYVEVYAPSNRSKYSRCNVSVYESGQIHVDNITIKGPEQSKSATIQTSNINSGTIAYHFDTSQPSWITGVSIDTSSYPYQLVLSTQSNSGSARSTTMYLTATDMAGDSTQSSSIVVTQNAPSSSDYPCTAMSIAPSGTVTMNNAGNTQQFDLTFTPSYTTQHGATWALTNSSGTPISSSVATLEDDDDPSLVDTKHVVLHSGASNTTLKLKATNTYNSSIVSNEVTINATYVAPVVGVITSDTYSVTLSANDDRCDTTNGAPTISASNLVGTLQASFVSGSYITSATISGNRLIIGCSYNTGGQRQSVVTVFDSGNPSNYIEITYIQLAPVVVQDNEISVQALSSTLVSGYYELVAVCYFINNKPTPSTFSNINYKIDGYNASNPGTNLVSTGNLTHSDITVNNTGGGYQEVRFVATMSANASVNRYRVTVTASSVGVTISEVQDGLYGDDVIDDVPGGDDVH